MPPKKKTAPVKEHPLLLKHPENPELETHDMTDKEFLEAYNHTFGFVDTEDNRFQKFALFQQALYKKTKKEMEAYTVKSPDLDPI